MENGWKKILCMEKSWNLKINWKSWNFGKIMELWHEIAFWMSITLRFSVLLKKILKMSFSFLNRAIQNHLFFIIKQDFSCSIIYATCDKRQVRVPYFEWSWKFKDWSWNCHGKIMELYLVFSVGTLKKGIAISVYRKIFYCLLYNLLCITYFLSFYLQSVVACYLLYHTVPFNC